MAINVIKSVSSLRDAIQNITKSDSDDTSETTDQVVTFLKLTDNIDEAIEALNEEVRCAICFEMAIEPLVITTCRHFFCKFCIKTSQDDNPTCPLCRTAIGAMRRKREIDLIVKTAMSRTGLQYEQWMNNEIIERYCKYSNKHWSSRLISHFGQLVRWKQQVAEPIHQQMKEQLASLMVECQSVLSKFPFTIRNYGCLMEQVQRVDVRFNLRSKRVFIPYIAKHCSSSVE